MRKMAVVSVGLLALLLLAFPARSLAQISVGLSVRIGPPALPVYQQPFCPEPGYIWTPGYWAYSDDGYYWVPGTWVLPPQPGLLWTPGYWGWGNDVYLWHAGYWGPQVGFYGGIDYGYGYYGDGYVGGRWAGNRFEYNTAVTRVNTRIIHNTYVNRSVVRSTHDNRVSFNGGRGGISSRPNSRQLAAERGRHFGRTSGQTQQEQAASRNSALRASQNHGRPPIAATSRPGEFQNGAEPARESIRPPANSGNPNRGATRAVQPNRSESRPGNVNPSRPENRNATPPPNRNVNPPNNMNRNRPENRNMTRPNPSETRPNRVNRPNTENQPHNQPHNNVEQNRNIHPEAPRGQPQREQRAAPERKPQPEHKAESGHKPESDHQH